MSEGTPPHEKPFWYHDCHLETSTEKYYKTNIFTLFEVEAPIILKHFSYRVEEKFQISCGFVILLKPRTAMQET